MNHRWHNLSLYKNAAVKKSIHGPVCDVVSCKSFQNEVYTICILYLSRCVFLKLKNEGRLQLKQTEIYFVYPSLNLNE